MLKISIIEGRHQRHLVLEGNLAAPWTEELKAICQETMADPLGRELVINLKDLTTISQYGENLLLELMKRGVRLRGCGLFTKEILKHLARRSRANGDYR